MKRIAFGSIEYDNHNIKEMEHTGSSDYGGSPVEKANHDWIVKRFGKCKGIYDLYGAWRSSDIGYNLEEMTPKTRKSFTEIMDSLSDYPCIDDDFESDIEWTTVKDNVFRQGSDFRKILLKNRYQDSNENLLILAEYVTEFMGFSNPFDLDYNDKTLDSLFARCEKELKR